MLKNYFKIALRNLIRNKVFSLINITGLTVGLVCFLLISLFIRHELSYDQFHRNSDRIYKILISNAYGGSGLIPAVAVSGLNNYPEVEQSLRLYKAKKNIFTEQGEVFEELNFYYADSSFFDVFSFSLMNGNPEKALVQPKSVVLSQKIAYKYFGEQNPIGQEITLNDSTSYQVTGIMNNSPSNSHLNIDFLASYSSLNKISGLNYQSSIYLLLNSPEDRTVLEAKFSELTSQSVEEIQKALGFWFSDLGFTLQPLSNIHLYPALDGNIEPEGDLRYLYIFGLIGVFILLIASINYTNLTTAQSLKRAKEIGVRKTMGAFKSQLRIQLYSESLLFVTLSVILALIITQIILPYFSVIIRKEILFFDTTSIKFWMYSLTGISLLGLITGSYPVFVQSVFSPIPSLKGAVNPSNSQYFFRKGLVVFQFVLSIGLIIGTLVIKKQLDYIQNKKLGFDTEQIVSIPFATSFMERFAQGKTQPNLNQLELFTQEFERLPGIEKVSLAYSTPNGFLNAKVTFNDQEFDITSLPVDENYLSTMNIPLVAGRNFDENRATDAKQTIIINETAARLFDLYDKIGQKLDIDLAYGSESPLLIGIVEDFNTTSLHRQISPTILQIQPAYYNSYILRLHENSLPQVLSELESSWKKLSPNHSFKYRFLDDELQAYYQSEKNLARVLSAFSLISILIASLGLFGLSSFMVKQKTKEIGIRKVLGASVSNIVTMLSKDFVLLVAIGFVIAIPVAWLAMNRWLADFAYRIEIGPGIFAIAGVSALAIALLTVSWQAIKAALANPVESLKNE